MPRYVYSQSEQCSCGAATLMVAMTELGSLKRSKMWIPEEKNIWKEIWKRPQDVSNIAKIAQYARAKWGRDASVQENLYITSALREYKEFKKEHEVFKKEMMIAKEAPIIDGGMSEDLFDDDARVMLAFSFRTRSGRIALHFILARKDNGQVWLMNPDGGLDHLVPKFWDWIENPGHEYTDLKKHKYIFTGVYVVLR